MAEDSEQPKLLSPEEEIKELERRLEEKKRELGTRGEELKPEKEIFREVLREHIAEEAKPGVGEKAGVGAPPATHILTDDLKKKADEVKKQEKREEQLRDLIEYALTHTIQDAAKIAQGASPYLLDELHDHLVDDYYEKLIQLRKIKPL